MSKASAPAVATYLRPTRLWSAYVDKLRPEFSRERLLRFGIITLEFGLIVWAMAALRIEAASVDRVLLLALCGFVVNHFLPMAWREPFFAALSVSSLFLVFGGVDGLWLLALGSVLIALCHVPLPFPARVGLIVTVAAVFAFDRGRFAAWQSPVPPAIWAILGSMFMFRLIVYLYDLRYRTTRFSVASAFSYFFMIPNVCLPLFPVVDYKTFQRSRYNGDALKIYQTGIRWMIRGVIHLLLYKFVYLELVIAPGDVVDGATAAQYIFSTLLLYLKVSGLFHLVVGILHMFGYGLPETHHLYFFSSSYADFWRRINIYWKDFILKVVFNPLYFALRKHGDMPALVTATMLAFSATWFFHSYQWFWIRGEFPLPWTDFVFWFGLGFILTINAVIEARWGRKRMLSGDRLTTSGTIVLALKIAATFGSLAVLWAIWSTPDSEELRAVAAGLLNSGPHDLALLLGIPLAVGIAGAIVGSRRRNVPKAKARDGLLWREATIVAAIAGVLIVVGTRPTIFEPGWPKAKTFFADVAARNLNDLDNARMVRGYYEDIGDVTRFNSELWTIYNGKPEDWDVDPAQRDRPDAIERDLIPSTKNFYKGAWRTINSHGMRDHEYSIQPPPATFRIALVGSSHEVGSGIGDDETYENLVEHRLNKELTPLTGVRYEILNFSLAGASVTRRLAIIRQRVFDFKPNLILFAITRHEADRLGVSAVNLLNRGLVNEFPFLKEAMRRAGLPTETSDEYRNKQVKRMLAPYASDAIRAALEMFRNEADAHAIRPAVLILEVPDDDPGKPEQLNEPERLARLAGLPVINLKGSFASVADRESLWLAPWDAHTNGLGNRLVAERLYPLLLGSGLIPTEKHGTTETGTPTTP